MRMWMIDPKLLCTKHLIGEHGEIHKFRHTFVKQYSINGRMEPIVQIEPSQMQIRHDELAKEMNRRKLNSHKSPYTLPDLSYLSKKYLDVKTNFEYNKQDLMQRCLECRRRIENGKS